MYLDKLHSNRYNKIYSANVTLKGWSKMPRNKYPEETVQKILDVSLKLFLDKGFEETTILDIVANLGGLSRGAFYHHFKSKEEVLDALGDKLFFDNNPFEKVKNDTSLSGLEKIKKVLKLQIEDVAQQSIGLMSVSLLKNPRILSKSLEINWNVVAPFVAELFDEGMKDGSIEKVASAKALSGLFVLHNFWFLPSIFPCTKGEFLERVLLTKKVFDKIGAPIIDEEFVNYSREVAEKLNFE